MALTDAQCRAAKPSDKTQKLSDGRGLYLQVTPGGSKLWRASYRWQGRQRTASFGPYPQVSLATARLLTAEIKDKLAAGIDPSAKDGSSVPGVNKTFKDAASEWFRSQEARWVSGYAARIWSRLEDDAFPKIGEKDVAVITPMQVLALLREVEDRGALEMAKRVRQSVSAVFRYSIASGWAVHDPAASLADVMKARPRQQHRAALIEADLPDFFVSLQNYSGERGTALSLKIIAHTLIRSAELRFAEWAEIEGETWRIPAERMKMRKEHIVPLSPQVRLMLEELKGLSRDTKWLLPGISDRKPISENTLIYGLYRAGYHSRATVHGFRSTASTILNESGLFRSDAIERQLAHVPANEVRSAYNAALYLDERREMMNWYSNRLETAEAEGLRSPTDLSHLLS